MHHTAPMPNGAREVVCAACAPADAGQTSSAAGEPVVCARCGEPCDEETLDHAARRIGHDMEHGTGSYDAACDERSYGDPHTDEDEAPAADSSAPGFYVLVVYGDTEPELHGPHATEATRDGWARRFKFKNGDEHGIFPLDVDAAGRPTVDAYTRGFFAEDTGDGYAWDRDNA